MFSSSIRTTSLLTAIFGILLGASGCLATDGEMEVGLENESAQGDEGGDSPMEEIGTATQALTSLSFSTFFGDAGLDFASAPRVDGAGNMYVARTYLSATTGHDMAIYKFSPTGALLWAVTIGGSSSDTVSAMTVDSAGYVYVVGSSVSYSNNSHSKVLVAKLNPSGTALSYYGVFGGTGGETPSGIAVDGAGNAYITGTTLSTDFPTTTGAYQRTHRGGRDGFVAKLNASGSTLLYSTYIGGSQEDEPLDIAVDAYGYAYIAGRTTLMGTSYEYPTTPGAFQQNVGVTGQFGFVTELNPSGTGLYYSTLLGGNWNTQIRGIAVNSSYNAYVVGDTGASNFPTTSGAFRQTKSGTSDAFVTKLNAAGSGLVYSTFIGGNGSEGGNDIALTSTGEAYITGTTSSTNFPTSASALYPSGRGGLDGFVAKLSASGSTLNYSTYLGASDSDYGEGIAFDSSGNIYVTGSTTSKNFPIVAAIQPTYGGDPYDGFLVKMSGL
ncbi:SBBP repeat-containing protein [Polyangium mundeleinium]|uniref:SBBP repeat-containing protein n=1 Tax=Polyangium mundeleinium TaxID=2995306 RepID=A0ABT5F0D2_9BACT|nr:SBBP repeat-containing protein [Polyangium mundeleinium]MDC0746531.1 SBBP repeat-containing protein [Polyangium mundeleinium]